MKAIASSCLARWPCRRSVSSSRIVLARTPARWAATRALVVRVVRAVPAAVARAAAADAEEVDQMLIGEIISVAIGALRANKLRSLLTMLGIVIGVGAVIAVVALGTGAQQAVKDKIAALGTTLLTVNPGQQRGGGGGVAIAGGQARLYISDAKALDEHASYVLAVQPEMRSQQQIVYGNKNASTQIIGTSPNYLEVRKYTMKAGNMFTAADDEGRQRVAVLGATVVDNLGVTTPEAIIGEQVRIRG